MKKKILLLMLCPILMATQCEEDYECHYSELMNRQINVENNQETYNVNDTIWLSSTVSSKLIYYCEYEQDSVIVYDSKKFKEGLFLLKLKQENNGLNAESSLNNFEFILDVGQEYNSNYCSNYKEFLPILSEDNLKYKYKIGIVPKAAGDFCIANVFFSYYENNPHLSIFENYNTLENELKFDNCGYTYTRYPTQNQIYFFRVQM